LQQIFRLLLENKTQEEIAHELNISTRTVARYTQRIDQRYGEIQRQKTDNTLFLECHLFKNRMLKLYNALETKALDDKTSGVEKAKCCEVAANIAVDVLKLESEGIRAVRELGLAASASANASSLVGGTANKNNATTTHLNNNNNLRTNNHDDESFKECNPNRKF
jgi:ABC-type microcin C transport system duplicated ATPase subunit YejF